MSCADVEHVLVMLLSGLRDVDVRRTTFLGVGLGLAAASAFFSSLFRFLSSFSFSLRSFSACRSRMMLIDCSDVRTRANVVGMPTRR